MNDRPKTIKDLFEFYYDRFKPIYNHIQLLNKPPIETFFEINAAFDHLSRHWKYDESEEDAVDNACRHLKRGCFDAFKIIVREARIQYDSLRQCDIGLIDCGEFQRNVIDRFAEIKEGATQARAAEGDSRDESKWDDVFNLWEKVYINCVTFEKEFFQSKKVEWAKLVTKKKLRKEIWRNRLEGVGASLVAAGVIWLLSFGYSSYLKSEPNVTPIGTRDLSALKIEKTEATKTGILNPAYSQKVIK